MSKHFYMRKMAKAALDLIFQYYPDLFPPSPRKKTKWLYHDRFVNVNPAKYLDKCIDPSRCPGLNLRRCAVCDKVFENTPTFRGAICDDHTVKE